MQTKKIADAKKILDALVVHEKLKNHAQLARMFGVAQSTLSTWISRGSVNADLIFRICKGIRYDWLLTGEGPMQAEAADLRRDLQEVSHYHFDEKPPVRVPLISWVRAGGWSEVVDPFQPGDADDWLETTATACKNAFATNLLEAGANLKAVSEILGHAPSRFFIPAGTSRGNTCAWGWLYNGSTARHSYS